MRPQPQWRAYRKGPSPPAQALGGRGLGRRAGRRAPEHRRGPTGPKSGDANQRPVSQWHWHWGQGGELGKKPKLRRVSSALGGSDSARMVLQFPFQYSIACVAVSDGTASFKYLDAR